MPIMQQRVESVFSTAFFKQVDHFFIKGSFLWIELKSSLVSSNSPAIHVSSKDESRN